MNPEAEKARRKAEIAAFYAAEPYCGWVEIGIYFLHIYTD